MGNKINWLAILASAVAGMALGFLFYGVLFLDIWAAGNGLTLDQEAQKMSGRVRKFLPPICQ